MSEEEQKSEVSSNSPKTSQTVLDQCRYDYEIGNFKSVMELASRYGINGKSLHARIEREDWEKSRLEKLRKIEKKLSEKAQSKAELWLEKMEESSKKDLEILSSRLNLEPKELQKLNYEELTALIRTKKVVDDIARRALGIPEPKTQVDVTSKGQSIGESLVQAIAKLRADPNRPQLTEEEKARILEAEIVDDEKP